jgi:hypothetical protein
MASKARSKNPLDRFKTEDLGQIVAAILTTLNRAEDGKPLKLTSRKQCLTLFLACEVLTELLARERKEELKARRTKKRQTAGRPSKGIF